MNQIEEYCPQCHYESLLCSKISNITILCNWIFKFITESIYKFQNKSSAVATAAYEAMVIKKTVPFKPKSVATRLQKIYVVCDNIYNNFKDLLLLCFIIIIAHYYVFKDWMDVSRANVVHTNKCPLLDPNWVVIFLFKLFFHVFFFHIFVKEL